MWRVTYVRIPRCGPKSIAKPVDYETVDEALALVHLLEKSPNFENVQYTEIPTKTMDDLNGGRS